MIISFKYINTPLIKIHGLITNVCFTYLDFSFENFKNIIIIIDVQ